MHALRSVDVWDTLLRRRCHPDAVKLDTARRLLALSPQLLPEYAQAQALLRLRCQVEGELAALSARDPARDDEYALHDVLAQWLGRAAVGAVPEALVAALAQAELEHEDHVCSADPGIREFLSQYPARASVFLSDFYMPASQLRWLLDRKGLGDLFDGGYSSCDLGVNKRSGRAYLAVQARHGVAPQQHLHIGDNAATDVAAAQRLGMPAVHYQPAREHAQRQRHERLLDDRGRLFQAIAAEAVATAPTPSDRQRAAAFSHGVALAPLLVGFALYTLEAVEQLQPQRLFFFTREGELFQQVYAPLLRAAPVSRRPADAGQLLEVSRLSTFAASLREVSTQECMRLWTLYSTQSMQALARTLSLDEAAMQGFCQRHGIAVAQPVRYPWQDAAVMRLFADAEFRAMVENTCAAQRGLLLDYLCSRGWPAEMSRVLVVDIGWRGSIQDNLALLLPGTQIDGVYLGLQGFLNPQPANAGKRAYGPDLNRSDDGAALFGNLAGLEMLMNSPNGSVTAYARGDEGPLQAQRRIDPAENAVFHATTADFQAGVLHAAQVWSDYVHTYALAAAELRPLALGLWAQAVEQPPKVMVAAQARLSHNETFGLGTFVRQRQSWLARLKQLFH